jgi:hypothetical protein
MDGCVLLIARCIEISSFMELDAGLADRVREFKSAIRNRVDRLTLADDSRTAPERARRCANDAR